MASWRIRFHDKWPHLASLYASTHNLDEEGKHPDPMMGQDNVFDPAEPYGAYRYFVQPSVRSEFSIEEPIYAHRPAYKDEESRSSDFTSGDSFRRGSTCRVLLCVFLVFSFIGVVVAAITLAVLLSQTPRPLRSKAGPVEEFESIASIYARDFNENLLDNSTKAFKDLEAEFCLAIEQMFTVDDSPVKHAFAGCEVIEFRNGSVQVRYRIKLASTSPEGLKMEDEIQQKLEEHFKKKVNEMGAWQNLKFNPRFLKKFIRIEPPRTTTVPPTEVVTTKKTVKTTFPPAKMTTVPPAKRTTVLTTKRTTVPIATRTTSKSSTEATAKSITTSLPSADTTAATTVFDFTESLSTGLEDAVTVTSLPDLTEVTEITTAEAKIESSTTKSAPVSDVVEIATTTERIIVVETAAKRLTISENVTESNISVSTTVTPEKTVTPETTNGSITEATTRTTEGPLSTEHTEAVTALPTTEKYVKISTNDSVVVTDVTAKATSERSVTSTAIFPTSAAVTNVTERVETTQPTVQTTLTADTRLPPVPFIDYEYLDYTTGVMESDATTFGRKDVPVLSTVTAREPGLTTIAKAETTTARGRLAITPSESTGGLITARTKDITTPEVNETTVTPVVTATEVALERPTLALETASTVVSNKTTEPEVVTDATTNATERGRVIETVAESIPKVVSVKIVEATIENQTTTELPTTSTTPVISVSTFAAEAKTSEELMFDLTTEQPSMTTIPIELTTEQPSMTTIPIELTTEQPSTTTIPIELTTHKEAAEVLNETTSATIIHAAQTTINATAEFATTVNDTTESESTYTSAVTTESPTTTTGLESATSAIVVSETTKGNLTSSTPKSTTKLDIISTDAVTTIQSTTLHQSSKILEQNITSTPRMANITSGLPKVFEVNLTLTTPTKVEEKQTTPAMLPVDIVTITSQTTSSTREKSTAKQRASTTPIAAKINEEPLVYDYYYDETTTVKQATDKMLTDSQTAKVTKSSIPSTSDVFTTEGVPNTTVPESTVPLVESTSVVQASTTKPIQTTTPVTDRVINATTEASNATLSTGQPSSSSTTDKMLTDSQTAKVTKSSILSTSDVYTTEGVLNTIVPESTVLLVESTTVVQASTTKPIQTTPVTDRVINATTEASNATLSTGQPLSSSTTTSSLPETVFKLSTETILESTVPPQEAYTDVLNVTVTTVTVKEVNVTQIVLSTSEALKTPASVENVSAIATSVVDVTTSLPSNASASTEKTQPEDTIPVNVTLTSSAKRTNQSVTSPALKELVTTTLPSKVEGPALENNTFTATTENAKEVNVTQLITQAQDLENNTFSATTENTKGVNLTQPITQAQDTTQTPKVSIAITDTTEAVNVHPETTLETHATASVEVSNMTDTVNATFTLKAEQATDRPASNFTTVSPIVSTVSERPAVENVTVANVSEPVKLGKMTTVVVQNTTHKTAEAAFLDEYADSVFIDEYIPQNKTKLEETSVIVMASETKTPKPTTSLPFTTTESPAHAILNITESTMPETAFTDSYIETGFTDSLLVTEASSTANQTLISGEITESVTVPVLVQTNVSSVNTAKTTGIILNETTPEPHPIVTVNVTMDIANHSSVSADSVVDKTTPNTTTVVNKAAQPIASKAVENVTSAEFKTEDITVTESIPENVTFAINATQVKYSTETIVNIVTSTDTSVPITMSTSVTTEVSTISQGNVSTSRTINESQATESVIVSQRTESINASQTTESGNVSKTFESTNVTPRTESGNVTLTTESATVTQTTKSANATQTTESANVSQTHEQANETQTTEAANVNLNIISANVTQTTESANASQTTKLAYITQTTEAANVTQTNESANVTRTTEAANVSETTEAANISKTIESANAGETTKSTNVTQTTESAIVSQTTEAATVNKTTESVHASETTESVNVSKTIKSTNSTKKTGTETINQTTEPTNVNRTTTLTNVNQTTTSVTTASPDDIFEADLGLTTDFIDTEPGITTSFTTTSTDAVSRDIVTPLAVQSNATEAFVEAVTVEANATKKVADMTKTLSANASSENVTTSLGSTTSPTNGTQSSRKTTPVTEYYYNNNNASEYYYDYYEMTTSEATTATLNTTQTSVVNMTAKGNATVSATNATKPVSIEITTLEMEASTFAPELFTQDSVLSTEAVP